MTESQNVEYKSTWRDEYLKWICGFANANGGKLFIGIDDKEQIVGIPNAKRLMEDIPNKVVQHLGLAIETNLLVEGNKQYGYFSDIDPQNGHADPLVGFISKN